VRGSVIGRADGLSARRREGTVLTMVVDIRIRVEWLWVEWLWDEWLWVEWLWVEWLRVEWLVRRPYTVITL